MFGKYEFKDKITDFVYSAFRSSYPDFIDEEKLTVDDIEIEDRKSVV